MTGRCARLRPRRSTTRESWGTSSTSSSPVSSGLQRDSGVCGSGLLFLYRISTWLQREDQSIVMAGSYAGRDRDPQFSSYLAAQTAGQVPGLATTPVPPVPVSSLEHRPPLRPPGQLADLLLTFSTTQLVSRLKHTASFLMNYKSPKIKQIF